MFCPKCGKINPDNNEVCSGCNAPLHEEEVKAPVKKKNTGKILIAIAVVVVAVVVVALVLGGCSIQAPTENMTF